MNNKKNYIPLVIIVAVNIILALVLKSEVAGTFGKPNQAVYDYIIPITLSSIITIIYVYMLNYKTSVKLNFGYPLASGGVLIIYWLYADAKVFSTIPSGIITFTIVMNLIYAIIFFINYKYDNKKFIYLYFAGFAFSFVFKDFLYLNETTKNLNTVGLFNNLIALQIFAPYFIAYGFIKEFKNRYQLNLGIQILMAVNLLLFALSFYVSDLGLISGAKVTNGVTHFWMVITIQVVLIIGLSFKLKLKANGKVTKFSQIKIFKNKAFIAIFSIVMIIVISIGLLYSMRNVIINQIAIKNYVPAFTADEDPNQLSLRLDVGEDIDPGLYTATYEYSDELRLLSQLLTTTNSSNIIGVKIYKPNLDIEFKVLMYPENEYNNIYLEEGDVIEVFNVDNSWLPNLVAQDQVVEYSKDEKQAGFYLLSEDETAEYNDNFGSSQNILYQYKDGSYSPRMFMPYNKFEDDVVASDGDIIYLESETLVNSVSSL